MTNWDDYYQAPAPTSSITRKISEHKIYSLIKKHTTRPSLSMCEFGGANSCFVEGLSSKLPINEYHIIDMNEFGLSLLDHKKDVSASLSWEVGDVLNYSSPPKKYDVVFSVGLIEHFDEADTARAIKTHFEICRPGGLVLITFPTPTLPYRLIRNIAERLGQWQFTDERPLQFSEVEATGNRLGIKKHRSINWLIGLTQGYLIWEKPS